MPAPKRKTRDVDAESTTESSDKKPFLLRLPPDLMSELRNWATQELRSLNGHIEYLLRDAVKRRRGGGDST